MKKNLLLLLTLVLILCLAVSAPALASSRDLSAIRDYVSDYEFYDIGDEVLRNTTVEGLMEALRVYDPYAGYYDPASFGRMQMEFSGDYVGIGVLIFKNSDNLVEVRTVYPGSGAEKAGLQVGDIILKAAGVELKSKSMPDVQELLTNDVGNISLLVRRGEQQLTMDVMRTIMDQPSVGYWMEGGNLGCIEIFQFTLDTTEQMRHALADLENQGMTGLVLDLRDCPGGVVSTAAEVAALFTGVEPVFFFYDAWGYNEYYLTDEEAGFDLPLAVLVNGNTASAAELLAASIQDWQAGAVFGIGTYGKGVYQAVVELPSGGGLVFTTGKYITLGMQDVDEQGGVTPDVLVNERGQQMTSALAWLERQAAVPWQLELYMGSRRVDADGSPYYQTQANFLEKGTSYAPAGEVLTKLGWEMHYYLGKWYAFNGTRRLILDVPNKEAISGKFASPIIVRNNTCYLPLAFLRHVGYDVTWNGAAGSVVVID